MSRGTAAYIVAVLVLIVFALAPGRAVGDPLIDESFTGSAVASDSWVVGGTGFIPCLTASRAASQAPVPGCTAAQESSPSSLPQVGDPVGDGALRLTSNRTDTAGYLLHEQPEPLTAGIEASFEFFAYNGAGASSTGADGFSFFLADGSKDITKPGGAGGSLGYAPRNSEPGLVGGYLGLGIDEFGNYPNPTEGRNAGCPVLPGQGFIPQSIALRGPGEGLSGYCLLGLDATAGSGGLSVKTARTRSVTGVARKARLVVDPPGEPGATVTAFIDFGNGAGFQRVFEAPLPPNSPPTFKFGFASSTGGQTNVHEIRFVDVNTIEQLPELTLTKTHTGIFTAGEGGSFQLQPTVSSDAGAEQAPVTVTDRLPAGVTVEAMPAGEGWDCSATRVGATTGSCTYAASPEAPLPPGTVLPPITLPVKLAPDVSGRLVNTAVASSTDASNSEPERTATDAFDVRAVADMAIAKHVSSASADAGDRLMYTLAVHNRGPSDATDVTVQDRPPAGVSLESAEPSQGSCKIAGGRLSCALGRVVLGGEAQILVSARLAAQASGTLVNHATIAAEQPDPKLSNNVSTATVTVYAQPEPRPPAPGPPAPPHGPAPPPEPQPRANLTIVKHAESPEGVAGEPLSYEIRVTNHGPATATDVRVLDTTSAPVRILSAHSSTGKCEPTSPLSCSLGSVGAGHTITIMVTLIPTEPGTLHNDASVTEAGLDPHTADNLTGVKTPVMAAGPTIRLTKTATPTVLGPGQRVTFHITLSSIGENSAREVRVCDRLPSPLVPVSAPGSRRAGGRICWSVASLAPGRQRAFVLVASAPRVASSELITNIARASGHNVSATSASVKVRLQPSATSPRFTG